jgi:hypothetical protein
LVRIKGVVSVKVGGAMISTNVIPLAAHMRTTCKIVVGWAHRRSMHVEEGGKDRSSNAGEGEIEDLGSEVRREFGGRRESRQLRQEEMIVVMTG